MTGWTLKRPDGTQKDIDVPKRTRRQLDRSKRNAERPPAPQSSLRRGRPDR